METRREEGQRVPETWGHECQNFGRLWRGRGGAEGVHLLLSRTLGSLLAAPRSCSSSVRVLAAGSLGFPLTCPGDSADRRAGLGGGTPPAASRGVAWDSWPPRLLTPPLAAVPGGELGSGRAAPSAEPGRSLHSALCPLLAAVSLPSAVLLPDSPDAAPARRALPLRASARSRIRASEADGCSPGSDPGSPLLGRGSRTRTHTVQFQAGTGSRALSARCCEATPQPLKRKREGDRERAGGGGGREEGWGDGEGGRAREFPPPPRSQVPLGINSWKPLLERKELRFLGGGSGWRWSEWMDRIEERGGFCPLPLPRYEVTTEALHSLE